MAVWKPVISPTSRFANGRFANVSGQFANVWKSVRKRYKHWYVNLRMETGRFANESFRQRSFRKRLWSVRKRVEVSSQTL